MESDVRKQTSKSFLQWRYIPSLLGVKLGWLPLPARSLESASQNSKMGGLGDLEEIQDFQAEAL
jgi:hypothetical protein